MRKVVFVLIGIVVGATAPYWAPLLEQVLASLVAAMQYAWLLSSW
jgi:hypothetical protein